VSAKLAKRQLVEPTYWTCPHGVRVRPEPALTYGPEVADLCAKANYTPDPQQELGLDLIFAINPDGSPATFAFCVICARQNLKSGLLLQACIGWLFVLEDVDEIAWSSHRLETSLGAMENLQKIMTGSPVLSRYLKPTRDPLAEDGFFKENGLERCELNTGQTIRFQTRTRDGGRGLGKKRVILDEAAWLKQRMLDALLPAVLAQPFPQIAYASSAPPLDDDAKAIRDVMHRGRNHLSADLTYLEWRAKREPCADPDCAHPKDALTREMDCALDREHIIREANPTLTTGRITMRTLRALRQELDAAGYMRECLGWEETEDDVAPPKLDVNRWKAMKNAAAPQPDRGVVVIDVEPDAKAATVTVVGSGPGGRTLVLIEHRKGTTWVAGQVARLRTNLEVLEVSLHPRTQAGSVKAALKDAEIEFEKLTSTDWGLGCTEFVREFEAGRLVHVGQVELDAAVAVGRTKPSSSLEIWDRDVAVPMGPLVSASVGVHRWNLAAAEKPKAPPPSPVRAAPRVRAGSIQTVNF